MPSMLVFLNILILAGYFTFYMVYAYCISDIRCCILHISVIIYKKNDGLLVLGFFFSFFL